MAYSGNGKHVIKCVVFVAICLTCLIRRGESLCNIDSNELGNCLPAVSAEPPVPPDDKCCSLIRRANLRCLCNYKIVLSLLGIDPKQAIELPSKCGLVVPRECHGRVFNFEEQKKIDLKNYTLIFFYSLSLCNTPFGLFDFRFNHILLPFIYINLIMCLTCFFFCSSLK